MNNALKSLFTQPDEMEAKISYQAATMTWGIINVLFILAVAWSYANENLNPLSLFALLLAEVVYFSLKAVLRWRMTRGGKDDE